MGGAEAFDQCTANFNQYIIIYLLLLVILLTVFESLHLIVLLSVNPGVLSIMLCPKKKENQQQNTKHCSIYE